MPTALVKMLNLDLLYPPFLEALLNLLMECRLRGTDYKCYSGHRGFDEQKALYEAYLKGGAKAAPPGLSAHNYGLAVDCAAVNNGKLSWDEAKYTILEEIAPKHGLITGAAFGDKPHIQWPKYVSGKNLLPLKVVYNGVQSADVKAHLHAVWTHIGA